MMQRGVINTAIENIRERAASLAPDLQPWGGYFNLRAKEAEALLSAFDMPCHGLSLEIGCSNGFNSCLLSHKSKRIVATDLFKKDFKTHSQKLLDAKNMFDLLRITNCSLLSCSGEKLPFKDSQFDMVFSLNTLEHIPNKEEALQEARRVLRKGGILIVTVPNFFSFIFYPLLFYKNAFVAMLRKMALRSGKETKSTEGIGGNLMERYPHFPFPEPHGAYATYLREIISYMPWNWIRLFKKSGFRVERVFSTVIMPWHLLSFINSSLPIKIYKNTALMEANLGRLPPLKYLGANLCVISKK